MKKIFTLLLMCSVVMAFGQVPPTDGSQFQTPVSKSSSSYGTLKSSVVCSALSISGNNYTACDSGSTTLYVSGGQCDYRWYSDPLFTNKIGWDDSLVTPTLYNDSTFYVRSRCPSAGAVDSTLPLPPHGSNFSGNVRGYYFVAPCDFIITSLYVPTDASTGASNVAVVLFEGDTIPHLWPATTNAFKTLGYWNNYTLTDTIPVCFYVDSGEVVGVYGNRADVNSYAGAPYLSSINGFPVTLTRSGMQFPLSSNPMQDIFTEAGGSISRVEFTYVLDMDTNDAQETVIVPTATSSNASPSICQGDSILLEGSFQTTAGTYYDTLQTVYGCDSVVTSALTVNALPNVIMAAFSPDTVCTIDAAFALPAGTPAAGTYSGNGVAGSNFDPSVAGAGAHYVTYTYTDVNSCTSSDSSMIVVEVCVGISDNSSLANEISVYPNPVENNVTIKLNEVNGQQFNMILVDAVGKKVMEVNFPANTQQVMVDMSALSNGIYFLSMPANKGNLTYKLTKK